MWGPDQELRTPLKVERRGGVGGGGGEKVSVLEDDCVNEVKVAE